MVLGALAWLVRSLVLRARGGGCECASAPTCPYARDGGCSAATREACGADTAPRPDEQR